MYFHLEADPSNSLYMDQGVMQVKDAIIILKKESKAMRHIGKTEVAKSTNWDILFKKGIYW